MGEVMSHVSVSRSCSSELRNALPVRKILRAGLEEFNSFLVSDLILLVRSGRIEILHSLATHELFQATGASELPAKRPEARICLLGGAGHCPALSSVIFSIRNTDWKT